MSFVFVKRPISQIVWRGDRIANTRKSSKNTIVVKATVWARVGSAPSRNSRKKTPRVPAVRIPETTMIRKRMSREDAFLRIPRRSIHDVRRVRIHAEREGRQAVRHQVD